MKGTAERDRRHVEKIVAQAWWNANLTGAGEKLRPLRHYLEQIKPKSPQTGEEILAVFREYQARGAPIRIRHIGPDGKELS